MSKSIHADLLATQTATSVSPYIRLIFTHRTGTPTYDYSFDPTVTTNRLLQITHREAPLSSYGNITPPGLPVDATIVLRNEDLVVPDLSGYYVDIGYGANTASGLRYSSTPRLWVSAQNEVSASIMNSSKASNNVVLNLVGVGVIMNIMPCLIGEALYVEDNGRVWLYQDRSGNLRDKTIYSVIEYLIETVLTAATGFTFTLDALGTQDDGIINNSNVIPWPTATTPEEDFYFLHPDAPEKFDTIGFMVNALMAKTKCYLLPEPNLAFKVVYPQASDSVNETYYSSLSSGHVFYENSEVKSPAIPAYAILYGNKVEDWSDAVVARAYSDEYDLSAPPAVTYTGAFVPIIQVGAEPTFTNQAQLEAFAASLVQKAKQGTFSGRTVVPHDARVELFDRVAVLDARGT